MSLPESFSIYSIQIEDSNGTAYCVQPGNTAALVLGTATDGPTAQQQWVFVQNPNFPGYYLIVNVSSGFCADLSGDNPKSGTAVQQYGWDGTAAQAWAVFESGSGFQLASNTNNQQVWSVNGTIQANASIVVYANSATTSDTFSLVPITNAYCCDLGFDWNAAAPNAPGSLQANLMAKPYNNPAWFTQLEENDVISFYIYDITTLNNTSATSLSNPSLTFTMSFSSSQTGAAQTPLTPAPSSGSTYQWQYNSASSLGNYYSAAFGQSLPAYPVGSTGTSQAYHLNTSGDFNFQAQLQVTSEGVTKTYIYDPEMIVGPST